MFITLNKAALALGKIGGEEARELLNAAIKDEKDPLVRNAINGALREMILAFKFRDRTELALQLCMMADAALQGSTFKDQIDLFVPVPLHWRRRLRRGYNQSLIICKGLKHLSAPISTDLVHWKELPIAIYPYKFGDWVFSGSAVVDKDNTAGFKTGDEDPLLLFYTAAGGTNPWSRGVPFTQCLAYSNDRGRTWRKYKKNPVLGHIIGTNRDPKVIWHAPTKRWVMALYLDANNYALFSSPNLKQWRRLCDIQLPGSSECPDIFELPLMVIQRTPNGYSGELMGTILLGPLTAIFSGEKARCYRATGEPTSMRLKPGTIFPTLMGEGFKLPG